MDKECDLIETPQVSTIEHQEGRGRQIERKAIVQHTHFT